MTHNEESFKRVQDYLDKKGPIKLERYTAPYGNSPLSIEEFENIIKEKDLKKFLNDFLSRALGAYSIDIDGTKEAPKKRRTVGDIYRILLTYNPTPLPVLYEKLFELVNTGEVISTVCPDIKKRVYRGYLNGRLPGNTELSIYYDEFKFDIRNYVPKVKTENEEATRDYLRYEKETF